MAMWSPVPDLEHWRQDGTSPTGSDAFYYLSCIICIIFLKTKIIFAPFLLQIFLDIYFLFDLKSQVLTNTNYRWSQMTQNNCGTASKTEKWESNSVTSSNSSHFDFSSNADEVFSQIGLPVDSCNVAAAEFITL